MKIEELWAVVWEARGGVSVAQVEELIRRNRQRFFSSGNHANDEIEEGTAGQGCPALPVGGYAVLGFARTMEEALEGRRAVWRMKKEAEESGRSDEADTSRATRDKSDESYDAEAAMEDKSDGLGKT